jgi:molecular chaperone HtpG
MYEKDRDKFNLYVKVLYDQALLIEGLPIEDPVEYANNVSELLL